jgi:hypothetical protein
VLVRAAVGCASARRLTLLNDLALRTRPSATRRSPPNVSEARAQTTHTHRGSGAAAPEIASSGATRPPATSAPRSCGAFGRRAAHLLLDDLAEDTLQLNLKGGERTKRRLDHAEQQLTLLAVNTYTTRIANERSGDDRARARVPPRLWRVACGVRVCALCGRDVWRLLGAACACRAMVCHVRTARLPQKARGHGGGEGGNASRDQLEHLINRRRRRPLWACGPPCTLSLFNRAVRR